MKNKLYTLILSGLLLGSLIPIKSRAQCECPKGIQPDSLVYALTLDSVTNLNTTISFPQMNAQTGTLICVNMQSWATTVLNIDLQNKENYAVEYLMRYTRFNSISGPGLSVNKDLVKEYGPYMLDPFGLPSDKVAIGPDTVFKNSYMSKTNSNDVSAYLGTGTVSLNYGNTGSALMLNGSNNYNLNVAAYSNLNFELTYYYCPLSLLATGITNFDLLRKDDFALLLWETENKQKNTYYQVEYSNDGRYFKTAGSVNEPASPGNKYQYQFSMNKNNSADLYFRIKEINPGGESSYSIVRKLGTTKNNDQGNVSVFPNPITNKIKLEFNKVLKGDYIIELINSNGQLSFQQKHRLNNTNLIHVDLVRRPPAGIYFLRTRNVSNPAEVNVMKVFLQ